MKAILACSFAVILAFAGFAYYLQTRPKIMDIATYIDGNWIPGEYRGCILIPPDRMHLYCGVNVEHKDLPWQQVLHDSEHTHVIQVAFSGNHEAVFWRCQKAATAIKCQDAGIKTEQNP